MRGEVGGAVGRHIDAAQTLIDALERGHDARVRWAEIGAELDQARALAAAAGADLARFDEARAAADGIYAHATGTLEPEAELDGRVVAGPAHAALTTLCGALAPTAAATTPRWRVRRGLARVGWWIALILMGVLVALCSND